jgi:uncharacterized protein YbjT (DUF2867 family)
VILLAGATGYVGGRLLSALESRLLRVRCLARDPRRLAARAGPRTEVVSGDLMDRSSVEKAMGGTETAYYLVHSMAEGPDFAQRERTSARNFGEAAVRAGVRRIIYLGGLGHGPGLSPHLKSRQDVGEILRASGIQVIEFRASIVLGAGSLSFELIRSLVERLPVMITPRWVSVKAQPISIADLIQYLAAALDLELEGHRIFEIGGADRVSYGEIMREYASQRGLHRLMIRVPILTPRLSSLWLALVTPVYARVGRFLIDSIRYPTVIRDHSAREFFPVEPCGISKAIRDALAEEDREYLAAAPEQSSRRPRMLERHERRVQIPPEAAFRPIEKIGRDNNWYYANFAWRLRGIADRLIGGKGNRWCVEIIDRPHLYVLRTEMKMPGRAWLQFEVLPDGSGSVIRQTAMFDPLGLAGRAYWYATLPIHRLMFAGMLSRIAWLAGGA